jgi:NTE family protein
MQQRMEWINLMFVQIRHSKKVIRSVRSLLWMMIFLFLLGCGPRTFMPKGPPDPLPSFYVPEKIPVALVLGSGGVRGMAHVGVIEELEAAGIPVDLIVGCSAGSIVGSLYADKVDVQQIKSAIWGMRANSILDINLLECRYGLSNGSCMQSVLDKNLCARTFDKLKIPLVVVASDLYTGELVPIGGGDLVKAVQASCSIPFVFTPCKHMGRILVDGSVINPVPVKVARDLGAEFVIAVDLCELLPKTYPTNLFQIANRSAEIAFMWQNQMCTNHADVIIRPRTCGVGTFNDDMKWQIYIAGRRAAREQLPRIKRLLAASLEEKQRCTHWRLVHLDCYTPAIALEP